MDSLSISSDRTKRLSVISKRTTRSDSALPSSHSQLLQKEIPVDLLFQEASMKNNVSAVKYLLTFDVDVNKKSQVCFVIRLINGNFKTFAILHMDIRIAWTSTDSLGHHQQ